MNMISVPSRIYAEYIGQCIKKPFEPNITYTLKFQAATLANEWTASDFTGDITILGNVDCPAAIIDTENSLEGNNGFELIVEARVELNAADGWQEVVMEFEVQAAYKFVAIGVRPTNMDVKDESKGACYTIIDGLELSEPCDEECDIKIDAIDPLCLNSPKITLTATPLGGVWSGNGVSSDGEFDPSTSGVGAHELVYKVSDDCSKKVTITVTEVEIDPVDSICLNSPKINLSATPDGGVWSGDGVSADGEFDPSEAGVGSHEIVYTSPDDCTDKILITVLAVEINPLDPLCLNSAKINLTAKPNEGVWSGNGVSSDGEFDPTVAGIGTHQLIYTVAGICSDTIEVEVVDGAKVEIDPIGPFCISDQEVSLKANLDNGVWSGNGVNNDKFDPSIAGVGKHTITYTVTGVCVSMAEIVVEVFENVAPEIDPIDPICVAGDDIQLTATVGGGVWSGNGVSPDGLFNPKLAGAGTHKIKYEISQGTCKGEDTIDIIVEEAPEVDILMEKEGCLPLNATLSYTTTGTIENCNWDFGDGISSVECNSVKHIYQEQGCFDVVFNAKTSSGCMIEIIKQKLICIDSIPVANFIGTPNPVDVESPLVKFQNTSEYSTIYNWDFAGISNSTDVNPSFSFPPAIGDYLVCLTVENIAGCKDSICNPIKVESEFTFYVPNAFTPNEDGVNDYFGPVVGGKENIQKYAMQIFNRWGKSKYLILPILIFCGMEELQRIWQ